MVVRIARVLSAGVVLALVACVQPAACGGWSLNPFASESKTTVTSTKVAKTEPTVLQKVGSGTKNFFNKTGETLGLKKPETKKYHYASPKPPAQPTKPVKSWITNPFQTEKKKERKTVTDWMGSTASGNVTRLNDQGHPHVNIGRKVLASLGRLCWLATVVSLLYTGCISIPGAKDRALRKQAEADAFPSAEQAGVASSKSQK